MYRGVIQQAEFMTTYLRRDSERRGLARPIHLGRIYRIVPRKGATPSPVRFDGAGPAGLVQLLGHENGWVRDRAQQELIRLRDESAVPALTKLALGEDARACVHALWTLDGMGADAFKAALPLIAHEHPGVVGAAYAVARRHAGTPARQLALLERIRGSHRIDAVHAFHGALALAGIEREAGTDLLFELATIHADNAHVREALLSSMAGREEEFVTRALRAPTWKTAGEGASLLLQGASACIVRRGNDPGLQRILDLCRGQSWQHAAVREGAWLALAERKEPLALARDPKIADPRFPALLRWPGHEPAPARTASARPAHRERAEAFCARPGCLRRAVRLLPRGGGAGDCPDRSPPG